MVPIDRGGDDRERGVLEQTVWGPTYQEMLQGKGPASGPKGLWDITWRDPVGSPRHMVLPRELTGVEANIVVLLGSGFPSGSHKVGAAYSMIMEDQLSGSISPNTHTLVFPSTGNYGIGGAWVGPQMGYDTMVVLPELMSRERFRLIQEYGSRYETTPGSESNVKDIFDRCREIQKDPAMRIQNQFTGMANYRFHYHVTGNTVVELVGDLLARGVGNGRCAAFVSAMGSAGTIAAGDRVKEVFDSALVVGVEPIQCPTLYCNGFGDHGIQGIGDKHVCWIHNVLGMDFLVSVDDLECISMLRVFGEQQGADYLSGIGIDDDSVNMLSRIFGISGVCNVIASIKTAKHHRLGQEDTIVTVLTDGIDRYRSVVEETASRRGSLTVDTARSLHEQVFLGADTEYVQEGTPHIRERWFNLKYFTWVEQQGKTEQELLAQKSPGFWREERQKVALVDQELGKRRKG